MDRPETFIAAARGLLGHDTMVDDPSMVERHGRDWRGLYRRAPLAVAEPRSCREVAMLVALCNRHGVGIVPQGGNTGLCGGAVPVADRRELVISLRRLDSIREVDPDGGTITVEAGCILQRVQQAAAEHGRFFPLRFGAQGSCQIGGCIATNAGGINAFRYGTTRGLVLGVEAVLPDGRVWDGLRALHKDNTGYDLKQLIVGSEGTLGIVTAATLRLHPQPRRRALCLAALPTIEHAIALLARLQAGLDGQLTSFELMDGDGLRAAASLLPRLRPVLPLDHPWYVLLEAATASERLDLDEMATAEIGAAAEEGLVLDAVLASNVAQAEQLWFWREAIVEAERLSGPSLKHDISVRLSAIPGLVGDLKAAIRVAAPEARAIAFGHLGDGNIHFNVWLPADGGGIAADAISDRVYAVTTRLGGSVSAEHGIGQHKVELLRRVKSAVELDLMARVKRAIDPRGLMNPGKVLRMDPSWPCPTTQREDCDAG